MSSFLVLTPSNVQLDLDSLACSIAYAWMQSEVHKKPTIPLIQTERGDLNLRAENIYALALAGVCDPQEQLLTVTDLADMKPFPSHTFALVDHNHIGASFTTDNPKAHVVAVIDHHEDEQLYTESADPRMIAPAGSCSSHMAPLCPPEIPPELATLLLSAILVDTSGLKPGGKALQVDYDAATLLVPRSTQSASFPPQLVQDGKSLHDVPALKDLSNTLSDKKNDVSHLNARDLLRRDYKEYTYTLQSQSSPSIKAGLATVPSQLQTWGTEGRLETAGRAWMVERDLSVLGVLTSFSKGKGKHRREMAWIVRGESLPDVDFTEVAKHLWSGLESSEELKVKKHKKFKSTGLEQGQFQMRVYKQGNASATRKAIAPLLKNILEKAPLSQ